jgi:repressor LexA
VKEMVTPLQHKVYAYVRQYILAHGYSPSLAEVASGIGISTTSISLISRCIRALVAAGWLQQDKKGYRNLTLAQQEKFSLPLLGRIAAGVPIAAIENKEALDLHFLFQDDNFFALAVKGDSMIDEGIFDGDFVICQHARQAAEGEIVVALVDKEEATLKRISYKTKNKITLIPANVALHPKVYPPERVQIQGIYKGLLRWKENL